MYLSVKLVVIVPLLNFPCIWYRCRIQIRYFLFKSKGKKVVLSIGGQNGVVLLPDNAAKQRFINSIQSLIDKYDFDGIDIDLESGIYLNGNDTNFKTQLLLKS